MPSHVPAGADATGRITTHCARPTVTGRPGYSETMPCEAASAIRARRLVRAACHTWGLSEVAEEGALIMSELVSNAIAHTRSRSIRVTVSRPASDRVRVAVVDRSSARPAPRAASVDDENGRGLAVIEAVSDEWGTDPLPWGKRVWAVCVAKAADTA
jgi:hypothetical protein